MQTKKGCHSYLALRGAGRFGDVVGGVELSLLVFAGFFRIQKDSSRV